METTMDAAAALDVQESHCPLVALHQTMTADRDAGTVYCPYVTDEPQGVRPLTSWERWHRPGGRLPRYTIRHLKDGTAEDRFVSCNHPERDGETVQALRAHIGQKYRDCALEQSAQLLILKDPNVRRFLALVDGLFPSAQPCCACSQTRMKLLHDDGAQARSQRAPAGDA